MTDADKPIWQLRHLTLSGDQSNRLNDVSLDIHPGVTAIVGFSGAGKTSLLNLLVEMETPQQGEILRNLPHQQQDALPVYWVPQDSGLWPQVSVRGHLESVLPGAAAHHSAGKNSLETEFVDKLLSQFDLLHRQHAFPGELSMGECSRLSVARALAAQPSVLLMDEPLAHVDPVRRFQYWNVIRDYLNTHGTSLLFSTHECETAIRESKWVVCLSDGNLVYTGATLELYSNPPDVNAGQFLGPLNCFTSDEAAIWLTDNEVEHSTMLRPEDIHLRDDDSSGIRIVSFQFCGSYAETIIENESKSIQKTIFHRPSGDVHHAGQRVRLETTS